MSEEIREMEMDTEIDNEIEDEEDLANDEDYKAFLEKIADEAEQDYLEKNPEFKKVSPERKKRQQKISELAKSGVFENKQKAVEMVVEEIDKFIRSTVNQMFYRTNNTRMDGDDVVQEVYKHICADIEKYKPEYSLTTYVKMKIVRAVQETTAKNSNFTTYYQQKLPKVQAAITMFRERGIMQPSAKDIHIETGLPIKTIINTLKRDFVAKDTSIDDKDDDTRETLSNLDPGSRSTYRSTPEQIVQQNEKSAALVKTIDDLSDVERQIIIGRYYENISWFDLAKNLGLQVEEVKRIHTRTLKALRTSPELSSYDTNGNSAEKRFNKREIQICPYEEGEALLNDLDLLDEMDGFVEETPNLGKN